MGSRKPDFGDGASPGKIFIGGLSRETTLDQFVKYFEKYGQITDSVIMKDRQTGRPRGFGFITYADPSVVDTVISEVHIINEKQVEIKRTIPKGSASAESRDYKTKKIFVGGIPTSVSEDEFKSFFSKYGNVVEREIIRDHDTKRSRGFGFIVFDSEQAVDTLLANGNRIDMNGTQVEVKKAEPKKPSNPGPAPAFSSDSRKRPYVDRFDGFDNPYSGFGGDQFGPPYRSFGGPGPAPYRSFGSSRFGNYGGYNGGGAGEFGGGGYGDFAGGDYDSKFGGYYGGYGGGGGGRFGGGYGGGGYGGGYGGSGLGGGGGGYGRGSGYGGYGGAGSGGSYDSGPGGGLGEAGAPYGGGRSGYSSGGSRYHPYSR